jgi:deazaflavin-dependent oxidoreductase (nitroreductase family)
MRDLGAPSLEGGTAMRTTIVIPVSLAVLVGGLTIARRRDRRLGTGFMNTLVNPLLVVRGLAGSGRSEIGILEHVGRRTGVRRLTPVHPEPTPAGYRIVVPLGGRSQWAQNVLAAGHCRLQLHDRVHELDEPMLVPAEELSDLPRPVRRLLGRLGVQYLVLRRFATRPGGLDDARPGAAVDAVPGLPQPVAEGTRRS